MDAIRKAREALDLACHRSSGTNGQPAASPPPPAARRADLTVADMVALLGAGPDEQDILFKLADEARRRFVGDAVHVRGIIEFSNYCVRNCAYCGLRRDNRSLVRYRMTSEEVVRAATKAAVAGYRTIVLQSGDDLHYRADDIARMVEAIKKEAPVAVTLSIGERSRQEYAVMRRAGADRFLLKHETADPELYSRLHPGMTLDGRIECLVHLRDLGFQVGSGNIVGLPGQTLDTLARDIALLRALDVEMAGIGPFIPHPNTPLASCPPGDLAMSLKVLAVARLALPLAHLPATTALATLRPDGRRLGLSCGANVVMPNVTPLNFRRLYEIYPGSIAQRTPEDGGIAELRALLRELGRPISNTRGDSPKPPWTARAAASSDAVPISRHGGAECVRIRK